MMRVEKENAVSLPFDTHMMNLFVFSFVNSLLAISSMHHGKH